MRGQRRIRREMRWRLRRYEPLDASDRERDGRNSPPSLRRRYTFVIRCRAVFVCCGQLKRKSKRRMHKRTMNCDADHKMAASILGFSGRRRHQEQSRTARPATPVCPCFVDLRLLPQIASLSKRCAGGGKHTAASYDGVAHRDTQRGTSSEGPTPQANGRQPQRETAAARSPVRSAGHLCDGVLVLCRGATRSSTTGKLGADETASGRKPRKGPRRACLMGGSRVGCAVWTMQGVVGGVVCGVFCLFSSELFFETCINIRERIRNCVYA